MDIITVTGCIERNEIMVNQVEDNKTVAIAVLGICQSEVSSVYRSVKDKTITYIPNEILIYIDGTRLTYQNISDYKLM